MTPKEKAKSLIDKYSTYVTMWTGGVEVERENVKQCATIAVDEVLAVLEEHIPGSDENGSVVLHNKFQKIWWKQVKTEIEKY